MNPTDQDVFRDDDHRFDLLVDGELSEPERRELLAGLDDEPGGWRCCALAFLEAQCWQDEFGSMTGQSDEPTSTAPMSTAPVPQRSLTRPGRVGTLLAMAASFLVALVLGSQLQSLWWGQAIEPMPGMQVAERTGDAVEPAPRPENLVPETPEQSDVPPRQRSDVPSSPWQMVTLGQVEGPDGFGEPVRLPAIERETVDQRWLQDLPTAMPAEVLQALLQSGHRIQQRRQWLPLRMKDGRRLVVPVEQFDVQYVGHPTL